MRAKSGTVAVTLWEWGLSQSGGKPLRFSASIAKGLWERVDKEDEN